MTIFFFKSPLRPLRMERVEVDLVWFDSERPILLSWTSTKLGKMCLAQGHNAVTPVRRLEPVAPRSRVKHSSTEPLRSPKSGFSTLGLQGWIFVGAVQTGLILFLKLKLSVLLCFRVKSWHFGHSDTHLQTVEIPMSRLIRILTVCLVNLLFIPIVKK